MLIWKYNLRMTGTYVVMNVVTMMATAQRKTKIWSKNYKG